MSLHICNELFILQTANSEICLQFILTKKMVRSNVTRRIVLVQCRSSQCEPATPLLSVWAWLFLSSWVLWQDANSSWSLLVHSSLSGQFVLKAFFLAVKWTAMAQVSGIVSPLRWEGREWPLMSLKALYSLGLLHGVCAWASSDSPSPEEKTSTEAHLPRQCAQDWTIMCSAQRLISHFWGNQRKRKQLGKKLRVPT